MVSIKQHFELAYMLSQKPIGLKKLKLTHAVPTLIS